MTDRRGRRRRRHHGGSNAGSNSLPATTDDVLTFSHIVLPIQTVRETPLIWRFLPTRDFNADAPDAGITVDFHGRR